jgi:membrane protease YdiL (CAAX protease family)
MNMTTFIKRHPVLYYFILTFIISWSGVFILAFYTGIPATSSQFEKIGPIAFLPFLLGPTIAGLILTGFISGKSGFHDVFLRLIKWHVSIHWYALAFLLLPVLAGGILLILSQFSNKYLPDIITTDNKLNLILTGAFTGIFGVLLEELGWTGFAIPKLRSHYSIFSTGLIVGVLWGAWHFLPVFWGCGDATGKFDMQLFLPGFFFHYAGLIPFRIILVWLYDQTRSILLPWIMHGTLAAGIFFIFNISYTGRPLFIYYLILAIALWFVVTILALYNGKKFFRKAIN